MDPVGTWDQGPALTAAALGGANDGLFIMTERSTGAIVVEKRFRDEDLPKEGADGPGISEREINAMIPLRGTLNIVRIEAWRKDYKSYHMPNFELGSLADYINGMAATGRSFQEDFIWYVAESIARALSMCHYGVDPKPLDGVPSSTDKPADWDRVTHRDVKPENIFVTNDQSRADSKWPRVVLGDFGSSIMQSNINAHPERWSDVDAYTPEFNTPEHPRHSDRSDVYQLGLLIQCMCLNRTEPLFHDIISLRGYRKHFKTRPVQPTHYSPELWALIQSCTQIFPRDRPNAFELAIRAHRKEPGHTSDTIKAFNNSIGPEMLHIPRLRGLPKAIVMHPPLPALVGQPIPVAGALPEHLDAVVHPPGSAPATGVTLTAPSAS